MSRARRFGAACLSCLFSLVFSWHVSATAGPREDALLDVIGKMREQEVSRRQEQTVDLHAAYLASPTSQQQTLISLSLGVNYLESNPRLALQYLSSAELACQDSDPLLPLVRFYLADAKYRAGAFGDAMQLARSLLHEDFGDYWLKQVHSLLIESLYAAGDHEQLISEFKEYSQRFSFSRRQEVLARMASESFAARGDHLAEVSLNEELARNYPATAESRWAFQKLEDATCHDADQGGYVFSEQLLSHLSKNVVLNTGLEDFLVAAVSRPVVDDKGRVHRLDANEKIEFFIHNHLFRSALTLTEKLYHAEAAKPKSDALPGLVYELGRIHLRLFEPAKAGALLTEFLDTYSHHPLVVRVRELLGDSQRYSGQSIAASASYAVALRSRPTPILRWLYFWSLYRGKDYRGALQVVERPGYVQPREGDEPYVVNYWHARILEKLNRLAEAKKIYSDILEKNGNSFYAMMIATNHPELTRLGQRAAANLASAQTINVEPDFIGPPSLAPVALPASTSLPEATGDGFSLAARAPLAASPMVGPPAPSPTPVSGAGRSDIRLIEDLLRVGLREAASAQLGRMRWSGFNQPDSFAAVARLCAELDDYRPSRNLRSTSFSRIKTLPHNWDDLAEMQANFADEWKVYYPLAYARILLPVADRMRMNPFLVLSIMRAESSYNSEARSGVGAQGLMQLMPYTALKVAMLLHDESFDVREMTKPEVNIGYGVYYLDKLLRYYNDNPVLAAAAYNGGPVVVNQWLGTCNDCTADEFVDSIPYKETRHYVREVMRSYDLYSRLYTAKPALSHISAMPKEALDAAEIF